MKRGDVVVAAMKGDYSGKPRTWVVVQADGMSSDSVTLVPTSTLILNAPHLRITVDPSVTNGLREVSQIMVDKMTTVPTSKIRSVVGRMDPEVMARVTRSLALWLGIA